MKNILIEFQTTTTPQKLCSNPVIPFRVYEWAVSNGHCLYPRFGPVSTLHVCSSEEILAIKPFSYSLHPNHS